MTREEAKAEAKKLAGVVKALNSDPIDVHGGDPLVGPLARDWIESGIVFRSSRDRKVHPEFAPNLLHDELSKLFDRRAGLRKRPIVVGGDLQRSARRFREWIAICIKSRAAAGRLMRDLERGSRRRMPVTDMIAAYYLSRIVRLGIFRCAYAKCRKLVLNTSGHGGRKYCTGARCAQNDKSARIMARKFAKVQEGKIRQANVAITKWPGTGDLKAWIVNYTGFSRRWVTEAARRGDIHLPGGRRETTAQRKDRAPSPHVAAFEPFNAPIVRIQRRLSDDWEDDLSKTEPRWIHDGKDGRGPFKTVKLDGRTFRVYR